MCARQSPTWKASAYSPYSENPHSVMSPDFFHASKDSHDIGSTISPNNTRMSGRAWGACDGRQHRARVEELLEEHRPDGAKSRHSTIFLFHNQYHALRYADAEWNSLPAKPEPFYIYLVGANAHGPLPLAMVDCVSALLRGNAEVERLANASRAYWRPDSTWRMPEYLCDSCEVKQVLDIGELRRGAFMPLALAVAAYDADSRRCREIAQQG